MTERLAGVGLWTADPDTALAFYRERLGMVLLKTVDAPDEGNAKLYRLGLAPAEDGTPVLELRHRPGLATVDYDGDSPLGYWKIGFTVRDIGHAYAGLRAENVKVGDPPHRFRDIAKLCHFEDPDGYCIELIERSGDPTDFTGRPESEQPLGSPPIWSQITLRVKDPKPSLAFYGDLLGMRLLARMPVPDYRFTLYFLAYTGETPPNPDLEALGNRDWLWNRPYLTLELQHRWGTENEPGFAYHTGGADPLGFSHISIASPNPIGLADRIGQSGYAVSWPAGRDSAPFALDPDGYRVSLRDNSNFP